MSLTLVQGTVRAPGGDIKIGAGNTLRRDADGSYVLDGTQTAGTITDLPETVQDIVGAMIAAGANISATYNDAGGTLTIAATGLATTAQLTAHTAAAMPHPGIGTRIYQTVAQSIPDNTTTVLTLGAESYDTHNLWTSGTPTRLIIPAGLGGMWQVTACVAYVANATGTRHARVHKNGALANRQTMQALATAGNSSVVVTTDLLRLVAGDYLELVAFQNSGAALNTVAGEINVWIAAAFLGSI